MKVLNLSCSEDHGFEGWFASEEDYQSQVERHLVQCPVCASSEIHKLPSAPRLNLSSPQTVDKPAAAAPVTANAADFQAFMLRSMRKLMEQTEDVGTRFAEEARKIHHGEAPQRHIRGQASREETAELMEEGIAVLAVPVPEVLKNTLQ